MLIGHDLGLLAQAVTRQILQSDQPFEHRNLDTPSGSDLLLRSGESQFNLMQILI